MYISPGFMPSNVSGYYIPLTMVSCDMITPSTRSTVQIGTSPDGFTYTQISNTTATDVYTYTYVCLYIALEGLVT